MNEAFDPCHLLDCTTTNIFVYEFEMRFLIKAFVVFYYSWKAHSWWSFVLLLCLKALFFENLCLFCCDVLFYGFVFEFLGVIIWSIFGVVNERILDGSDFDASHFLANINFISYSSQITLPKINNNQILLFSLTHNRGVARNFSRGEGDLSQKILTNWRIFPK